MLYNWVCPKCHRKITKYVTICSYWDCDGKRGYLRWLLNIDNPFCWGLGAGIILLLLAVILAVSK